MRIMYAVCSWGFGHVTRSLPIIRKLIKEGHELTIITCGKPKYMLMEELGKYEDQVRFVDIIDYPLPYTLHWQAFLFKFIAFIPEMFYRIQKENDWVIAECKKKKYDMLISDNRYGIYNRLQKLPSFLITHQLRMVAPGRFKFMEWGTEHFVSLFQKYFKGVVVPDFEDDGLAGILCHDMKYYDMSRVHYIGALSDFPHSDREHDLDGYISVSGPEPQRTIYEDMLRGQIHELKGNWIMSLGTTKGKVEQVGDVKVFPYLTTKQRIDILSRTDFVISRSGYTTIMDLSMGGQKALFSPTPGQTEQEYLSEYHNEKGTYMSVNQESVDLLEGIKEAKKFAGVKRGSTDKAVEAAMDIFFGMDNGRERR
jgi:uncharacterized protein (TIGR00661 family)